MRNSEQRVTAHDPPPHYNLRWLSLLVCIVSWKPLVHRRRHCLYLFVSILTCGLLCDVRVLRLHCGILIFPVV